VAAAIRRGVKKRRASISAVRAGATAPAMRTVARNIPSFRSGDDVAVFLWFMIKVLQ
jgi:hypothetical protein